MFRNLGHIFLLLFIGSVYVSCQTCSSQEGCTEDDSHNNKYSGKKNWDVYLSKIKEALENYKQCQSSNHGHYAKVIMNDLQPWKENGISEELINESKSKGTHYQIINHKLYREEECMFPFRCAGVEHFILEIIKHLPNMEFILNTRDWPQANKYGVPLPIFSFSKTSEYFDVTYPAWTFWKGGPAISLYPTGLGRWDLQRDIITKEADKWPWNKKENKGFFRGSRTSSERDPLILLSRQNPDLVDAQYTKNQAWKSDKDTLGAPPAKEVSLESHCHFKYLFNFRGVAASFRFKHLFLCRSLVFNVESEWTEFFYSAMKPWVHYIPVQNDLKDIRELMEFASQNDETVQEIAERGHKFIWENLKQSDVSFYWKQLLRKYADLLKYKPKRNQNFLEIKPDKK